MNSSERLYSASQNNPSVSGIVRVVTRHAQNSPTQTTPEGASAGAQTPPPQPPTSAYSAESGTVRIPRPLSPEEWAEAERIAARLHAELRRLIGTLPEHARHASGLSRHLNVLRVTCQRVVQSIQDDHPTPLILTRLPGVEGLGQFLSGFGAAGVEATEIDGAEAAVAAFAKLIKQTGGSQTKLTERLLRGQGPLANPQMTAHAAESANSASPNTIAGIRQREALFESAVNVTGRRSQTVLSMYAFKEDLAAQALERGTVKGMIGNTLMPGGMPMVLNSGDLLRGEDEVRQLRTLSHAQIKGRTPEAILRPFSTDPLPSITSRQRGGTLMQYVDSDTAAGQTFDLVTALRGRNPLFDQGGHPSLETVWSLVNAPTRALVVDVWLHIDMERKYRPSADAQLWNPGLLAPPDERWAVLLPAQPQLQLLGRGPSRTASEHYPRLRELTEYFFAHMEWDPDEFVGFRCEVRYPIWRAGYCMAFDYYGEKPTSASAPPPTAAI